MPNTFELIASSTVGAGGASSILFSSIPSTYTDLIVKCSARDSDTSTGALVFMSFNGVTTNRTLIRLRGNGSAASSASSTSIYLDSVASTDTANTFGNDEFYIPNYANSSYNKSVSGDGVGENNATNAFSTLIAGLWSSTAAITSITLTPGASPFLQHSSFYLYGVKNA